MYMSVFFFFFKVHKLILKSNSHNTKWIVDPFTQIKSAEHIIGKIPHKINFKSGHILWFFFHADVKMLKTYFPRVQNVPEVSS